MERVARVDRGWCLLLGHDDPVRTSRLEVAAGDLVEVEGGQVVEVLPRRSALVRRAAGETERAQVLAANVDWVLPVAGLDRPLNRRRLQRELVLAWDSGAEAALVLTKADVVDDGGAAARAELASAFPEVAVLIVSARSGGGIDDVAELARPDRTLVLVGPSGAGKSTLANRLLGEEVQRTGEVRGGDQKGRHTTTSRHLFALPGGGFLVDTPGLREVGLWDAEEGLSRAFADVESLAEGCRFRDCAHATEPGCAVRAAIDDGRLDPQRLLEMEALQDEVRRKGRARGPQGR